MATNKKMINKFKDMAECADAAYAKLHYVYDNNIFFDKKWNDGDNQTLGDKIKDDVKDDNGNILHTNGNNTTYARAIEARFMQDFLITKQMDTSETNKDNTAKNKSIKIGNDPKNVLLDSVLSHRTKNFVNRYELIHHIPNTLSGFSATIFYDIRESNTTTNTKESEKHFEYIIAFRGTEADTKGILSDVLGADVSLATAGMAITQANALELLSKAIFRAIINHHTLSSKKENSHIYDKNLGK